MGSHFDAMDGKLTYKGNPVNQILNTLLKFVCVTTADNVHIWFIIDVAQNHSEVSYNLVWDQWDQSMDQWWVL